MGIGRLFTMVNIFFTDTNPIAVAKDSCDSYVVKIPIEVALLLSAIHWRTGYDGPVSSGMPNGFISITSTEQRVIRKDFRRISMRFYHHLMFYRCFYVFL